MGPPVFNQNNNRICELLTLTSLEEFLKDSLVNQLLWINAEMIGTRSLGLKINKQ